MAKLKLHRNANYTFNGTKSLISAYTKYNVKATKPGPYQYGTEQKALMRLADGTPHAITADDQQNDAFYTCAVQVGTPAQTVHLDFDSGSSDMWMWSTKLSKSIQSQGKSQNIAIFDPSKSSTFQTTSGASWKITYGDGSGASGIVGTDNIKIGDITIKGQSIELATQLSKQFLTEGSSGLLGLAFGSINTVKPRPVKTPVDNMIAQNDIPANAELFTVYLGSVKDVKDPDMGQSFYTFGSIDNAVVKASGQQIAWTPVDNSQGFWMFDSTSYTINGKSFNRAGGKAIADTGTTLLLTSDDVCKAIYDQIAGAKYDNDQQGYVLPVLKDASSRPKVTFAVGGAQFTIEQEQLAFTEITGTNMAYGGIQSRGSLDFDIFGDTFLVCVYAIFDVGNTRFGCVQRADPTPAGK